jgi:aryl-alcohol dehydrogenase-like predicted oxidoreductase
MGWACEKAAAHCKAKGYPNEKLAMQFACSCDRIASTVFSTTRPEAIRTNLAYLDEPIDWQLVQEVKDIIGDQQRVSWANT